MAKPKPLLGILAALRSEVSVFYWFFYRSLVEQFSFRSWFVMRILGMIVGVTTYSIFAYVVPSADINAQIAAEYGFTGRNPFLDFFLIGMLVQNMITLGGTGISRLVNSPFYPYYHSSPTRLVTVLFGNSSFRYTWVIIETIAYVCVGLLFGMTFYLNIGFFLVVLTGIFLIFSLDLLSAGWNIITKTGVDPLNWFLELFSRLVSGTWIPVWTLPPWLRAIAAIHPQRYINDLARSSEQDLATAGHIDLHNSHRVLHRLQVLSVRVLESPRRRYTWPRDIGVG